MYVHLVGKELEAPLNITQMFITIAKYNHSNMQLNKYLFDSFNKQTIVSIVKAESSVESSAVTKKKLKTKLKVDKGKKTNEQIAGGAGWRRLC